MRDFEQGIYRPVVSEILDAEIEDAPATVQETYQTILRGDHELIEVTEEADDLASVYLARGILSPNYNDDALHIASATVAEVDILVSWNFHHIVHFDKIRQFNATNLEQGYKPIDVRSPREVTTHGDERDGDPGEII